MSSDLPRMITKRELRQIVPYSPQHIGRLEKRGLFPKRTIIGPRRVGWWLHEVMEWLDTRPDLKCKVAVSSSKSETHGTCRSSDLGSIGNSKASGTCQSSSRS